MPRLLSAVLLFFVLPLPQNGDTIRKLTPQDYECAKDPGLCLWKNIKRALLGPDGAGYFNAALKGAILPLPKGKVVKLEPPVGPKTIVLAIEDGATPDATLKFNKPLPGKVEAGTELSFEGVAESYSASPFMVVFEVDRHHLQGWPDQSR